MVYSRFTNPTVSMLQDRLAALEGAEACVATASGMSAILATAMSLLKAGDHIVCSSAVFGATVQLFTNILGRFGVETTFVSPVKTEEWERACQANTKLFFLETPSNPLTEISDIAGARQGSEEGRRAARGGQRVLHAGAAAAARARRRPRDPLGHQASRRPGPRARRRGARREGPGDGARVPVPAHRRALALALQRVGDPEGPRDPRSAHARAVAGGARARALAGRPSRSRARLLSRAWNRIRSMRLPGASSAPAARSCPSTSKADAPAPGGVIDSTRLISITANLGDVKTHHHPSRDHHARPHQPRSARRRGNHRRAWCAWRWGLRRFRTSRRISSGGWRSSHPGAGGCPRRRVLRGGEARPPRRDPAGLRERHLAGLGHRRRGAAPRRQPPVAGRMDRQLRRQHHDRRRARRLGAHRDRQHAAGGRGRRAHPAPHRRAVALRRASTRW